LLFQDYGCRKRLLVFGENRPYPRLKENTDDEGNFEEIDSAFFIAVSSKL
jgi:hypothetical protein